MSEDLTSSKSPMKLVQTVSYLGVHVQVSNRQIDIGLVFKAETFFESIEPILVRLECPTVCADSVGDEITWIGKIIQI